MLTILKDKFSSVALWFYDKASVFVAGTSKILGLASLSSLISRRFSKPTPLVFIELFVAISLAVNFFFLVKPMCLPKRDGNAFSGMLFSYMSDSWSSQREQAENQVPLGWRTRLMAPIASGKYMDAVYHQPFDMRSEAFQRVFGSYQAAWVFLLFLALILFRKDALLVMLGVFSGLMYNFIEPAGMYYYPWDMPALFFFTLACLLYDRRWYWPLLLTVYMGSLFKETTLCCAFLMLFDGQWSWVKRIGGFLGTVIATLATAKMLEAHYHVHTAMLAMQGATSLAGLFPITPLLQNIKLLFGLELNHVLFVNAGSLFIVMLLPWRNRRDVVFKLVMLAFIAGQALYGIGTEVRIWYEMLPLGWMLLSERISDWRQKMVEVPVMPKAAPAKKTSGQKTPEAAPVLAGKVFQGSYWLILTVLFIVSLGFFALAEIKPPPPLPTAQTTLESMRTKAQSGDADAEYKLGMTYEQNQDYNNAITWFQKAAQQGSIAAQDALGVLLVNRQDYADAVQCFQPAAARGDANGELDLAILILNGQGVRQDPAAAAALLEKAAPQGAAQAQYILGLLYGKGQGEKQDYVQAYKWLKLAQIQGYADAGKELTNCLQSMTPAQIASAQNLVNQSQPSKQ
jgi:Sel1 repeat